MNDKVHTSTKLQTIIHGVVNAPLSDYTSRPDRQNSRMVRVEHAKHQQLEHYNKINAVCTSVYLFCGLFYEKQNP